MIFVHQFSRKIRCTVHVTDEPPPQGEAHVVNCGWSGRLKPKHIPAYRQWILCTNQTLADRWQIKMLYALEATRATQRGTTVMNVSLSCPEHDIHDPWMPKTTRGLAIAGFTDQDIFNLLREATRNARRTVPDNEIRDTIATIRGTSRPGLDLYSKASVAYEPAYLEERAARLPNPVDEAYLEARSQFTCWNRTPAGFLHKIFRPGESVWITANDKSSDGLIWTHDGFNQQFDELAHVAIGQHSVWFLTNPIDAELNALSRRQSARNPEGLTYRAIECVTDCRYMLIESDEAPADLWLKVLVQFELPIVAIYHSGKRSHHALARFDAKSKRHWDELCEQRRESLIRLGACGGSLTALRLSRLPNCVRGETGLMQRLLALAKDQAPRSHMSETFHNPQTDDDRAAASRSDVKSKPRKCWARGMNSRTGVIVISHKCDRFTQSLIPVTMLAFAFNSKLKTHAAWTPLFTTLGLKPTFIFFSESIAG